MNFYTLEYDCNTPTVQQINVPTNSDYKIGMKVKRNGSVQSIKPSEFTITGTDGTTLSADPEKTNGYVTITKDSGDNASFKQFGVHINKGYDFDDYIKLEGLATTNDGIQFPADTTAESLGIGGMRMYADKVRLGYNKAGTEPLTPDDCTYWIEPATVAMASFIVFNWPNGQAAVWMAAAAKNKLCYMPLGSSDIQVVDYVDIDPSWILRIGSNGLRPTLNKYYIIAYDLQLGTPFSADFKLNINEFKSQKGDINLVGRASTVNFAGTDGQGNPFSYDVIIK